MIWLRKVVFIFSTIIFSAFAGALLLVTETWRECEALDIPQLNAAIILGNEFTEQGELTDDLQLRLDKAIQLFHNGNAYIFILSSIEPSRSLAEREAVAMKTYLIQHGIPEGHLIIENHASNAIDNIQFAKLILDSLDCDGVFVIAGKPQLCRALLITEHSGIFSVGLPSDLEGGLARLLFQSSLESFRLLYFLAVEQWTIPEELLVPDQDMNLRYTVL